MIQQRIIQYIDFKGISKYKFYKITGLSNGFLDKSGTIGVDKCEIIFSYFPELNLEWLITGKGEMLKQTPKTDLNSDETPKKEDNNKLSSELNESLKQTINAQQDTINSQRDTIELHKKVIFMLYEKSFPHRMIHHWEDTTAQIEQIAEQLEKNKG